MGYWYNILSSLFNNNNNVKNNNNNNKSNNNSSNYHSLAILKRTLKHCLCIALCIVSIFEIKQTATHCLNIFSVLGSNWFHIEVFLLTMLNKYLPHVLLKQLFLWQVLMFFRFAGLLISLLWKIESELNWEKGVLVWIGKVLCNSPPQR